jgi:N6-L-threonylcarbamoyladenine synthase
MLILGIETSCDETSAGVVKDGSQVLSNVIKSQIDIHKAYGGVVPEVAARNHIEVILTVINKALTDAKVSWEQIDGIAVTNGPGLMGSLLIGTLTARTLSWIREKPIYPVHHVLGHIYANWLLPEQPKFPVLALIVSGGHTHLFYLRNHLDVQLLGRTQDDAVGEAYDKVAKLIGLPYPGGPAIDGIFKLGNPDFLDLPTPKVPGKYDFSFSGLKTAVLRRAQQLIGKDFRFPSWQIAEKLTQQQVYDIAASFQKKAVQILVDTTKRAFDEFQPGSVIIGGGVACNSYLRDQLQKALPIKLNYTPIDLCTDNGAMIATLGCFMYQHSSPTDFHHVQTNPSLKINYTSTLE